MTSLPSELVIILFPAPSHPLTRAHSNDFLKGEGETGSTGKAAGLREILHFQGMVLTEQVHCVTYTPGVDIMVEVAVVIPCQSIAQIGPVGSYGLGNFRH